MLFIESITAITVITNFYNQDYTSEIRSLNAVLIILLLSFSSSIKLVSQEYMRTTSASQ